MSYQYYKQPCLRLLLFLILSKLSSSLIHGIVVVSSIVPGAQSASTSNSKFSFSLLSFTVFKSNIKRTSTSSSINLQTKSYSTTKPTLYTFQATSQSSNHELLSWPLSKPNTILNIVPQGTLYIIERLGKYDRTQLRKAMWINS